jgi:hypothetical protein
MNIATLDSSRETGRWQGAAHNGRPEAESVSGEILRAADPVLATESIDVGVHSFESVAVHLRVVVDGTVGTGPDRQEVPRNGDAELFPRRP